MSRVVIVGAGLFGSIIAAHLRKEGHEVTVVADQRAGMGSVPAACLMKPSWASSMGKEYDRAIELLDGLYGVRELQFDTPPFRAIVTAHWVDPRQVLKEPDIKAVADINGYAPGLEPLDWGDQVIFATGQWADLHDPQLQGRLSGKGGWSFLVEGNLLGRGLIQPWAPYRQLVAFQIAPDVVWVGDGAALKKESMTPERMEASRRRCEAALDTRLRPGDHRVVAQAGFRPYVKDLKEPAYIREVKPGMRVVTGGAKNGTLGAAWAARQIAEQLA